MLILCVSVGASAEIDNLSDQQLLDYANQKYEKRKVALTKVTLGAVNGFSVVAEYLCSDLCPDHTVRVIHFEHPPEKTCTDVGGVEVAIPVPVGISVMNKMFCVPKVLASSQNDRAN